MTPAEFWAIYFAFGAVEAIATIWALSRDPEAREICERLIFSVGEFWAALSFMVGACLLALAWPVAVFVIVKQLLFGGGKPKR